MSENTESYYLRCSCHHPEHLAVFEHTQYALGKDLFLYVHLNKLPIFKRIVYAIKYIFGLQREGGAFSEIYIDDKSLSELIDFLIKSQNIK